MHGTIVTRRKVFLTALLLGYSLLFVANQRADAQEPAAEATLRSPDGKNVATLGIDPQSGMVVLEISRDGRMVVETSPLEVEVREHGSLSKGAKIQKVELSSIDESYDLVWGKASRIAHRCSHATVSLQSSSGLKWTIDLRAYNDGIALRYGIPRQQDDAAEELVVESEAMELRLAREPQILYMVCDHFKTPHEGNYQWSSLGDLPHDKLLEQPLLATWDDGMAVAISEANLMNYSGMYLKRPDPQSTALRTILAPLPDDPTVVVRRGTPIVSPWRLVMLADRAGELIESTMHESLCDPPKGDYAWLKPGKCTWHWWNGTSQEGLGFQVGMNFATHRHYIDFCAKYGIEYHAVVADERPWHVQSQVGYHPGPDTDILTPRPELELPKIMEYAKSKGVGIRLWVAWEPLNERLEEAFATYKEWGADGLMVDFLDRNDQEMVEFNQRVLEAASRHQLHIQFHGSYPPTGEHRTYPHMINREGVLNLEFLKWSDRCTPDHNVHVAYTRLLAGPTDYHLGGFRAVPRSEFRPSDANPVVMGTRCHHLAMYVIYENIMPMVSDTPSSYEGQEGFEFIQQVPTTWDETRFVGGEVGKSVAIARRKGNVWYVGGMTDYQTRQISVDLELDPEREFEVTLYRDADLSGSKPNALVKQISRHPGPLQHQLPTAPGGGFVAVVRPVDGN